MIRNSLKFVRPLVLKSQKPAPNFCLKNDLIPKSSFFSSAILANAENHPEEFSTQIQIFVEESSKYKTLFCGNACQCLIKLSKSFPEETKKVVEYALNNPDDKDEEKKNVLFFRKLIKAIESDSIGKADVMNLVTTLKTASILDIPSSSFMIQNIENSLMWRCRSANMKELVAILSISEKRKNEGEMSRKLFETAIDAFELRWVEIQDPLIAIGLMHYNDHFKDIFLAKLEDRMIKMAEEMSTEMVIQVRF